MSRAGINKRLARRVPQGRNRPRSTRRFFESAVNDLARLLAARLVVFCRALGACALVRGGVRAASAASDSAQKTPFFDRRQLPLEYAGPGREIPEPENVAEVRIGYFGPDDPAHPEAGDLWCAASLAIEEANGEGGYQGRPFRLIARWSEDPWTGGAAHLTRMVYEDRVWAIVGGIDSASTHLAEQITTKAWLPLLCASSSDRTANLGGRAVGSSRCCGESVAGPFADGGTGQPARPQAVCGHWREDHDSRSSWRK